MFLQSIFYKKVHIYVHWYALVLKTKELKYFLDTLKFLEFSDNLTISLF